MVRWAQTFEATSSAFAQARIGFLSFDVDPCMDLDVSWLCFLENEQSMRRIKDLPSSESIWN